MCEPTLPWRADRPRCVGRSAADPLGLSQDTQALAPLELLAWLRASAAGIAAGGSQPRPLASLASQRNF